MYISSEKVGFVYATIYIRKQILNQTISEEFPYYLDAKVTVVEGMGMVIIKGDIAITKEYSLAFSSVEIEVYARNPIECNAIFYIIA